jgi:hypothetical protein
VEPTAQAFLAEIASMPDRLLARAGLGLATRFQVLPFQWTIRVPVPAEPTAQASLADVTATARRLPLMVSDDAGLAGRALAAAVTGVAVTTPAASRNGTMRTGRVMW